MQHRGTELLELINAFRQSKAREIFSDNVFLDKTDTLIEIEVSNTSKKLGADIKCSSISMSAGLEAKMLLSSKSGRTVEVTFSLSPFDGGKIQEFKINDPSS